LQTPKKLPNLKKHEGEDLHMIHNELNKQISWHKTSELSNVFDKLDKIPAATCHVLDPAPVDVLSCEAPPAAVH